MNDVVSDNENSALTHQEAVQILRLSPAGLRRLADLDEAITELRAARRSLLANRLESIRDAFAAARMGRAEGDDSGTELPDQARAQNVVPGSAAHSNMPTDGGVTVVASPRIGSNGAGAHAEAAAKNQAGDDASLPTQLRMLRTEVAELRREVAALKGPRGGDPDLQQIDLRLSYLEAELESREI